MDTLLTRNEFRNAVFARDKRCVECSAPYQDAHHIMERRLWPDGGYYLNNGASLCGECHLKAESTELGCASLRLRCGIKKVLLPPHLYQDQKYDKWGNICLPNGTKLKGELFYDESVQKILIGLEDFVDYIKYPRSYHLPTSPGVTKDDRVMPSLDAFAGKEVIITEKMDGENTTIYSDYCHARSVSTDNHPSKDWVKGFAASIGYLIDPGWRVCGENMWAKHSIPYESLKDYFLGFSVWDDKNFCLSWDDTLDYFELIGVHPVPELYRGPFSEDLVERFEGFQRSRADKREGFVIRLTESFHYSRFRASLGKWVRENHVQSAHNWKRQEITRNKKES